MIGIYKIISPSNKIYIGQSNNIEKRFYHYKYNDCKCQPKLYNSFLKYGYEHHIFEVIEECIQEVLNDRERYWQEYYNVLTEGLNCKLIKTDDRASKQSEETKLKISNSHKGKKLSEYTKAKLSLINRKGNHPQAKKVICNLTGKIWDTIDDCANENNIKPHNLSRYLRGIRKNKTTLSFLIHFEDGK